MKLYRFRPSNMFMLDELRTNRVWAAPPKALNDPFEQWYQVPYQGSTIASTVTNIDDFGIVCFTETRASVAMWTHYAGAHTGVCIEYEIASTDSIDKVCYTHERPAAGSSPEATLLTKGQHWSYEEEYRWLVRLDDQCKAGKKVEVPGEVTRVTFGLDTSSATTESVRDAVRDRQNVHFDCSRMKNQKYELYFRAT